MMHWRKIESRKPTSIVTIFAALIVSTILVISPPETLANDSMARFAAGGIELLRTEQIRMVEEVLEISPLKVRVKYRFFNESDQDTHTTVAFPLPPEYRLSRWFVEGGDPDMILATFKVLVDGKPVAKEVVRKATIGDRDITDQLRKLGLSDREIFFEWNPNDEPNLLDRLNRFRLQNFDDWWRISQTLFWQMTFPAKKETVVEHEYAPASGAGLAVPNSREPSNAAIAHLWSSFTGKPDSRKNEDCPDETTKRAIENRVRMAMSKGEAVTLKYSSVEYILGTGRNWKGPIGEFTLRLVKEKPDQFVSVCFPGQPEKISPTVYEFYQKDFVPQDTLVVYFYTVEPG